MSATGAVAVIGSISTPVVAIVGFWFNNHRASVDRSATDTRATADRDAARDLANDRHDHERSLEADRYGREVEARRSNRAYDERRGVYKVAFDWALTEVQRIQLAGLEGVPEMPPAPAEPPPDVWNDILVGMHLFGSTEARTAYEDFRLKAMAFRAATNDLTRAVDGPLARVDGVLEARAQTVEGTRAAATLAFERLGSVMTADLAAV